MQASGRARVETEIVDISVILATGIKGIAAVSGITERGPVDSTILVGTWAEFRKHFGGFLDESEFPLLCRRSLDAGGKLRVSRDVHYTDATDASTVVGVEAAVQYVGGAGNTIDFTAKSIGTWGNGLSVTITENIVNAANMDILIKLTGYPELDQLIKGVKKALDAAAVADFNNKCELAVIDSFALVIAEYSTEQFIGGLEDKALIVAVDQIGDSVANTGIYRFNDYSDFVKVASPALAIPTMDSALVLYAKGRGDCLAVLRTPIGISGLTAIDYREGEGVYSHTPLDDWHGLMFTGGLKVNHPATLIPTEIPALGNVLANMSTKDNKFYEWFSFAGAKRGRIFDTLGVDYNLASPARTTEFDQVDEHGINAVVDDPDYGTVIWGNSTLQKADTLLKHANVAELLIYINRTIAPIVKGELFDPNDIETWKTIYRKVRPLLKFVKDNRGWWKHKWEGDQFIDKIEDAIVNDQSNIDAGQYISYLWIAPKVGMKYAGIKIVATNSGVSFEAVSDQV